MIITSIRRYSKEYWPRKKYVFFYKSSYKDLCPKMRFTYKKWQYSTVNWIFMCAKINDKNGLNIFTFKSHFKKR